MAEAVTGVVSCIIAGVGGTREFAEFGTTKLVWTPASLPVMALLIKVGPRTSHAETASRHHRDHRIALPSNII
jgi:hypothetical protein